MQLSEVEKLTTDYSQSDVNEIAAVAQSTVLSTPSAILRWGNVQPRDAENWLRTTLAGDFKRQFELKRITSIYGQDELPSIPLAEHLVVRDLDMGHLDGDQDNSSPGRIVAHADYRYTPSYGNSPENHESEENSTDPSTIWPPGFGKGLHLHINEMVGKTLAKLFGGLPCFELHGISTLTPSHLRKGIAKKLTEWIFPFADQLNVPVVLCASPMGLPLYRKCGFVECRQHDIVVELEKWGGEGIHKHVTMVRWPERIEGLPDVWKAWREMYRAESGPQV